MTTERLIVADATTAEITWYANSLQAYENEEYKSPLEQSGFADVEFRASLGGGGDSFQSECMMFTARKR